MPVLLGASALRIVPSSDLVYQIMAESHIAKCPGLAGRSKAWVFADRLLDLLCDSQIIGVRLTVYQVRQIQITSRCPADLAADRLPSLTSIQDCWRFVVHRLKATVVEANVLQREGLHTNCSPREP